MAIAIFVSLVVLAWYCTKAYQANPARPNWHRAIVKAALWPLSLLMKRYR